MLDKAAQQKYKKWLNKHGQENESYIDIFHRNRDKFQHKDIYRYSLEDLKKEIVDKNIESNRRLKANGSEKLLQFEDKYAIQLVRLDSYEAVKKYLSNTRLCITDKRDCCQYFNEGKIFYSIIINSEYFNEKYTMVVDVNKKHISKIYYNKLDDYETSALPEKIIQAVKEDINKLNSSNNYILYFNNNDAPINKSLYKDVLNRMDIHIFYPSYKKLKNFANKHSAYVLDRNITNNKDRKRLINLFTINTLIKHLDVLDCQVVLAKFHSTKYMSKLDLSNKTIKNILKERARENPAVYNKCIKLGVIKRSELKNKKVEDIKKQIKELQQELQKAQC